MIDKKHGLAALALACAATLAPCAASAQIVGDTEAVYRFRSIHAEDAEVTSPLAVGPDGYAYGATASSSWSEGRIFRVEANGNLRTVHAFAADGSEGHGMVGRLVVGSDGWMYGTTVGGGQGAGTIFRLSTDGRFELLHTFTGYGSNDGVGSTASLVEGSDGSFYGTLRYARNAGVVFRMLPDRSVVELHRFGKSAQGLYPAGGVVFGPDGRLYGTAAAGGAFDGGVLYAIGTDGSGFEVIHSFECEVDGCQLQAPLLAARGGDLYGMTRDGGLLGDGRRGLGTVFRFRAGAVETLHTFGSLLPEGAYPMGGLSQDAHGRLYGTTSDGGPAALGAVFALSTRGVLTVLHEFGTVVFDGGRPETPPTPMPDGRLRGTTQVGGRASAGVRYDIVKTY
jgi:uncharacterized repeat protein (TIGR03803 family)